MSDPPARGPGPDELPPVDLELSTAGDPLAAPPLAPGTRFGRYLVQRLLGSGGMGEVYLAEDVPLGRQVALKRLAPRLLDSGPGLERFRREARAASAFTHPNVIAIYEAGEIEGQHFIASEFVRGRTLRRAIGDRSVSLTDVLELVAQAADGLSAAHEAGIVHRDVKPDNLMIRDDGWLKVLDFGLAKSAREALARDAEQTLVETAPNVILGTVQYMSPEQARGQHLDARSDVWSLAVVAIELLTFKSPFARPTSGDALAAILRDPPPPLPPELRQLDGGRLERLLLRSLAKERADRPATMRLFLDEWRAVRDAVLADGGTGRPRAIRTPGSQEIPELAALLAPADPGGGHNLPEVLSPLIGREAERATIGTLLRERGQRLVTLTGPGGTGKTRLALQAARDVATAFPGGVRLVKLAAIDDPALVPDAIASALGVREDAGRGARAVLRTHLQARARTLLVLDNVEQVLGCVGLVDELLEETPALAFLATSRERLHHRAEAEIALDPLPVPPVDAVLLPAALLGWSAVALFVRTAQAVRPDFRLDATNGETVAEICRRVDGLPLAIELAAARVKMLTPAELLARLDQPLGILTTGARDLPERQRTMRSTIAWGHALLDEREQALFRRAAVFVGGFSIPAAEAVGGGGEVLDQLHALVDKSLLRRSEGPTGTRFDMLRTLREYAVERLREAGEDRAVRDAHARYFTGVAEHAAAALEGPSQPALLDALEADHPNLRAAWDHAVASPDHALALRMAAALWWFWYLRGHYAEGRRRLEHLLQVASPSGAPDLAGTLLGAGVLAFLQCDYSVAETRLRDALGLFRDADDTRGTAWCLQYLGGIARERGEARDALALAAESRAAWVRAGSRRGEARAANAMALVLWLQGDFTAARREADAALAAFRADHDGEGVTWALLNLASVARHEGAFEAATRLARESLSVAVECGYQEGIAWSLDVLGNAELATGATHRACRHLRKAVEVHWGLGDRWRLGSVLESLALALVSSDRVTAASVAAAARRLREEIGAPVPPVEQPLVRALEGTLAGMPTPPAAPLESVIAKVFGRA